MFNKAFNFKKQKKSAKIWTVVGFSSLFFVLLGTIVLFLATKDDYIDAYNESSSGELIFKIGTSTLSGQEVIIKQEELNSFFNFFIKSKAKNGESSDFMLEGINILENNKGGDLKIYLPVTKNGAHFGIVANTHVSFENKYLKFYVNNTKVGRLPIPKSIFLNLIKQYIPKNFEIKNDCLLMPGSLDFEFTGSNLVFNIEEFRFLKENIVSKFSADKKSLREFIENKAKNFVTGNVKDLFCKLV